MKKIISVISLCFCLLFSTSIFAGTNPIGWSLSPGSGFPAQTKVGSSYAVSYTMTNNLPFAVPLTITPSYTGGAFTLTNGCNRTLAAKGQPGSTCLVHIGLQPLKAGKHIAQITLDYHRNRVPLPALSTESTGASTSDIVGHITTPLPAVTYTGVSYPVEFSFANISSSSITATAVNVNGFTANTNTCTSPLAPNSPPCTVSGNFAPSSTGSATLSVTYVYNPGSGSQSVPLSTQTNVHSGSGPCHHVSGQVVLPLPTTTYIYADNVVKFTFTNNCDASTETLGNVSIEADSAATIITGTDGCSNQTLAPNGSCDVTASVVPMAVAADLSVIATAPYDGITSHASAVTSTQVLALSNTSALHTVMFVNQCNQNVWYEFANGTGVHSPDPTPQNQRKFSDYQMNLQVKGAAPSTKVLSFSEYINGNIYGRTQCMQSAGYCQTASCEIVSQANNDWACKPDKGVTGPATLLEEYMPNAVDSDGVYDVTVINGLNIPAEMKSLAPTSSDLFGCGQAAGATIQPAGGGTPTTSLGACSWSFSPPTTGINEAANFIWVTPGADDGCTDSTPCGTGLYCGMAYASVTAVNGGLPPINRRCGAFLGYWQVGDYVVYPSPSDWGTHDLYTNYSLDTNLILGPTGYPYGTIGGTQTKYKDIYTCPIPTSTGSLSTGYNSGNKNVCGCHQWTMTASSSPCAEDNADWESIVYPQMSWIKDGCPTAYTYQFDDKSVSFTCQIPKQKTSYQITYCPGGKTGAPGT